MIINADINTNVSEALFTKSTKGYTMNGSPCNKSIKYSHSFSICQMFNHDVLMSRELITLSFVAELFFFISMSYLFKMMVITLHVLYICSHYIDHISSFSKFGAHRPLGFLAPFATRSSYGIAVDNRHDCLYKYYLCNWTWRVYVMAIEGSYWI